MSTAIFTSDNFPGAEANIPVGRTIANIGFGKVQLKMSDGSTKTVFDNITTALKCLKSMRSRTQYYLQASDEIVVINCESQLLIFETTFTNQKDKNSYAFCYYNHEVIGIHRQMSTLNDLTSCLVSVGYKKTDLDMFQTNFDFENLADNKLPHIKVVDFFFQENASDVLLGSVLNDDAQIVFANTV